MINRCGRIFSRVWKGDEGVEGVMARGIQGVIEEKYELNRACKKGVSKSLWRTV